MWFIVELLYKTYHKYNSANPICPLNCTIIVSSFQVPYFIQYRYICIVHIVLQLCVYAFLNVWYYVWVYGKVELKKKEKKRKFRWQRLNISLLSMEQMGICTLSRLSFSIGNFSNSFFFWPFQMKLNYFCQVFEI